jgi:hypothetical protein
MNKLHNPAYIKLLHCIRSCKNYLQISTLTLHVIDYANKHEDGHDLLLEFETKKNNLMPLMQDEQQYKSLFL